MSAVDDSPAPAPAGSLWPRLKRLFPYFRGTGWALPLMVLAIMVVALTEPMIPALKAITAHFGNDAQWKTVRPPLVELTADQERELIRDLKAADFSMPGL